MKFDWFLALVPPSIDPQRLNNDCFVQVLIVGVPVILILQDVSSNARFLGYSLLVFTFPVTTTGLIVLPKVLTVRRMTKMANEDCGDEPVQMNGAETEPVGGTDEDIDPPSLSATTAPANGSAQGGFPHGPRIQVVTFD